MGTTSIAVDSLAEAYLTLLADRGVDYLFGNSGTDFPSIIEALCKAEIGQGRAPVPVTVPHENLAVAMAHGYYLATGRAQAVMFHVNVGTANGINGALNAARANVPVLFTAGRTPVTEDGHPGSRSIFIHWGQEMFDQAAMVREAVKWDYELRTPSQIESVVDRALNVAMTEPRGPVYLSLPREVLADAPGDFAFAPADQHQPATDPAPDPAAIERLATMIASAQNPVILTGDVGRDVRAVPLLAQLTERFALPVCAFRPRTLCLPSDHPMMLGYEPQQFVQDADLLIVLETDVPWIPALHGANPEAPVVHIGVDPHFSKYVIRGFRADLAITAAARLALPMLETALEAHDPAMADTVAKRRERLGKRWIASRDQWRQALEKGKTRQPIATPWLAHCIDEIRTPETRLVSEAQLPINQMHFTEPGSYFGTSTAGGLGWGLGAALGLKLADRKRDVISVVGDGAYMFGGPTPAHFVGASMDLPVLTIILNNRMWGSVRKATLGLYPDGAAAKSNRAPLTVFEPTPDYEKLVEACGGYGERVEAPGDLPDALQRCLERTRNGQQAVLNVITEYSDDQARADAKK